MSRMILIGGLGRSGTALTRRIVGSNSRISIPPTELTFFSQFERGKSMKEILSSEILEAWRLDFRDLWEASPREAFTGAILRYRDHSGKEIPGEKTPRYEFYYDVLQEWLADFQLHFIHLVRNPFDVIASYKYFMGSRQYCDVRAIARNWRRSVAMGAARALENPAGYFMLRFEDLTADPAATTRKLCAFLEVAFEESRMLSLADYPADLPNTSFETWSADSHPDFERIRQPVSRKGVLNSGEIRLIGSVCGELARAIGYPDGEFRTRPPEPRRCWSLQTIWGRLKSRARKFGRSRPPQARSA